MDMGFVYLESGNVAPPYSEISVPECGEARAMVKSEQRPSAEAWMTHRKEAALPPHLEPNPITSASPSTQLFLNWLVTTVATGLLILGYLRFGSAIREISRKHPTERLQTVSILFEPTACASASLKPFTTESTSHHDGASFEESIQTQIRATDFSMDSPEIPKAAVPDFPLETNLLPTQRIGIMGIRGTESGGIGKTGHGNGMPGGYAAHWSDGSLQSGDPRGITVQLDSLDVMRQEIPPYPDRAREQHISGEVVVDVVIDEKGFPRDVQLVQADHPLLVPEVLRAAPKWRFAPVTFGGRKVGANFRICFRFTLELI